MAKICENGVYREMTAAEIATLDNETPDALNEMAAAMSKATNIAQMREAAKIFLEKTGGDVNG